MPDGWAWTRIISISQDLPYGTARKSEKTGDVAVIRMGNLQSGEITYKDLVYSSNKADIEKYQLLPGDLLFNRTNSAELVGKTAIYRGTLPAIYAGYLIRLRMFLDSEYTNAVMNSGYAKAYCDMVRTDAINQSNINAQKLGKFLIPVPPLAEEKAISKTLAIIFSLINDIEDRCFAIRETIEAAKAKILDLAIRGQLVPQDPADEPASALLERIRAEKEELIKQGKIKRDKKESVIFRGEDNSYYEKIGSEVRCIDEDIPFEIPNTWEWMRLGNCCVKATKSRSPKLPFSISSSTLMQFSIPSAAR